MISLIYNRNRANKYFKTGNNAEDDEQDEEQVKVTKKREHRQGNTLEKDITNLDLKKLDTEFTVDPLFRKTSADFDEGGARGLLLNHLSIASNGQIIFDASDALTDGRQEDAQIEKELIDMYKLKGDICRFKMGDCTHEL